MSKLKLKRSDGVLQRYNIADENLGNYVLHESGEYWEKIKIFDKYVLVTVRLDDYGDDFHDVDFQITYCEKANVLNAGKKETEMLAQVKNAVTKYFGYALSEVSRYNSKTIQGIADGEKEELTVVVRGRDCQELKDLIWNAKGVEENEGN